MKNFYQVFIFGIVNILFGCLGCHAQTIRGREVWVGPIQASFVANGQKLPMFSKARQLYLQGSIGQQYQVKLTNTSGHRIEVLVSVDGRSVVDLQQTNPTKQRGYILLPHTSLIIPGFRTSMSTIRSFRFSNRQSSVGSKRGTAGDIGNVHFYVFREKGPSYWIPLARKQKIRTRSGPIPKSSDSVKGVGKSPNMRKRSRHLVKKFPYYRYQEQGLGTKLGQSVHAPAKMTTFFRASLHPTWQAKVTYDSCYSLRRRGLPTKCRVYFIPR